MKISELIKQLNEILYLRGDLEVKDATLRTIVLSDIEEPEDDFVTLYTK